MTTPRVFVFDLDGVLYRGTDPVEGAAETLAALRQRPGVSLFFLTNNSTQDRSDYVEKLTRFGMPCTEDEVITSAFATAMYLAAGPGAEGKVALAVGGHGIRNELARVGITVRRPEEMEVEGERIDYVVVGLDRDFNYHALLRAQQAILGGATFIATNRDGQFPAEGGTVTPGAGAVVAAIQACTGVVPDVIGKPETLGLKTILDRAKARPEEAVMIGDRCDTDVLCGNRLGVPTVLVLTGVTTEAQALAAPPEQQPGRILATLRELIQAS
ncbi:MAG: HAD-IIA family hydrolase [Cytophagales bacterium]|nr:HAD-IIA family hydrolase [Armatimonadota bacterium]